MSITIEDTLRRIVAGVLGLGENEILDDSTLEGLGADSLDKITFLIEIETKFTVEFADSEWDRCKTFTDYVALVTKTVEQVPA